MSSPSHAEFLCAEPIPEGASVKVTCKDFDELNPQGLVDELFAQAADRGDHILYLDLDEVEYLSSGMLGVLIVLDRRLQNVGGRLVLLNLNPGVYEVFHATRVDDLLDIHRKGEVGVA